MKQRVGIVRALATGPKVLLLDEPFGALDAQTRVIMQQILTNMWQRLKISVLFVTHDIDEAIFLSDRVYCMTARPGSIKAEISIPLERPRQQSMMMSSEFVALRRGLMSLICEESLKPWEAKSATTACRASILTCTGNPWPMFFDRTTRKGPAGIVLQRTACQASFPDRRQPEVA
jgi:ABC-type proline/glycine betaine transport system ATPase subunit